MVRIRKGQVAKELVKDAHPYRKGEAFKGHIAGNCRKLQEGFRVQDSRTLANVLSTKNNQAWDTPDRPDRGACKMCRKNLLP